LEEPGFLFFLLGRFNRSIFEFVFRKLLYQSVIYVNGISGCAEVQNEELDDTECQSGSDFGFMRLRGVRMII